MARSSRRRVYDSAIWDETDPTDFYYFVPECRRAWSTVNLDWNADRASTST